MKKLIIFLILIPFAAKSQNGLGSFDYSTNVGPTETKSTNTVSTKVNVVNKNIELAENTNFILILVNEEVNRKRT